MRWQRRRGGRAAASEEVQGRHTPVRHDAQRNEGEATAVVAQAGSRLDGVRSSPPGHVSHPPAVCPCRPPRHRAMAAGCGLTRIGVPLSLFRVGLAARAGRQWRTSDWLCGALCAHCSVTFGSAEQLSNRFGSCVAASSALSGCRLDRQCSAVASLVNTRVTCTAQRRLTRISSQSAGCVDSLNGWPRSSTSG